MRRTRKDKQGNLIILLVLSLCHLPLKPMLHLSIPCFQSLKTDPHHRASESLGDEWEGGKGGLALVCSL